MEENRIYIAKKMNEFGSSRIPFLFIINFDLTESIILPLANVSHDEILYQFGNIRNDFFSADKFIKLNENPEKIKLVNPVLKEKYIVAFHKVQSHIENGDTYLLNLTFPTGIESSLSMKELYFFAQSKYKLFIKDRFVCFSPEPFVKISNNSISSYPMKGTISAHSVNAESELLSDEKELAEHYTIVDLLRNDLSIVSKNVRVEKFRYVEKINTSNGEILQTSSKIIGILEDTWKNSIGNIIVKMLPAGSVTGAPKKKTVEIINSVENYERGFYTGVAGVFDGNSLDSCVLIRFIEQTYEGLMFKSGGGITCKSNVDKEYLELLEKVYVASF